MLNEVKMPDLLWCTIEERIQRLRENEMVDWIYHLRPAHPPSESLENTPFTMILRSQFVRRALATMKSSMIALLCGSEITVGALSLTWGSWNMVRIIGNWANITERSIFLMAYQYAWRKEVRGEGSWSTGKRIAVKKYKENVIEQSLRKDRKKLAQNTGGRLAFEYRDSLYAEEAVNGFLPGCWCR